MSKVICPNCGSEVRLPEKSSVGIGMTISKETDGDFALPLETVRNNNVNKNNVEKKEINTMNNMNGMNGFDMDMLAKMVAAQLSGQNVQTVTQNIPKVDVTKLDNCETDQNHWAENSQFYGKEICGYAYNPYMIRRFLPAQFNQLIEKYDGNVHRGITKEYAYMYSITYTLEEVRKLAMLQKRDKIAFDERKYVFTINQCKRIFEEYIDNAITHLNNEANKFARYNKVGKEYYCGIKGFGWMKTGVVAERIENHRVVKYLEMTDNFKRVFDYLIDLKEKVGRCWKYKDLYRIMSAKDLIKVPAETKKSSDFMDCFIKAGSYYTLKQQLMFDNTVYFKGNFGRVAVIELRKYLERGYEGYKIYAMLKEVNNIR
jgi:hypothetical protein